MVPYFMYVNSIWQILQMYVKLELFYMGNIFSKIKAILEKCLAYNYFASFYFYFFDRNTSLYFD